MPRKFSISFRESSSARAATKSNITFGHFKRMAPYNLKGKGNIKGKTLVVPLKKDAY